MSVQSDSKLHKPLASVGGIVAGLLAFSSAAQAQGTAPAEEQATSGGIEEVLVTANKRQESAQSVPVAITAITAEEASKLGVVNGQSLAQSVPGLSLNRQTNGTQAYLRGVGTASTQAGNEPAVALYVDDIYMGSSALQLGNYNSIARIEVLKGPQGTLFGRNATGGVIQVYTKSPTPEKELVFNVGYDNYQTYSGSVYASGSLSDNVLANLHVYSEKQFNGWGTNFTTGSDSYRQTSRGARGKVLWNIGEATTVLFSADYDNYFNQQAVYFRPVDGTLSGAGVNSQPPPGRYDTFEAIDPEASVEQSGGSVKVTHDFGSMQFVSITGYRKADAIQDFEQDGARIYRQNPRLVYHTRTYTQELQLLSGADSSWNWVGGLFLLNDDTKVDPFTFRGIGAGGVAPDFLTALGVKTQQKTDSYAAFFQTTYPITDKFNVTAGIRYSKDDRELNGALFGITATGNRTIDVPAINNNKQADWSSTTARLVFDYKFTPDFMAYVGFNKGFKSGLFNTILSPTPPIATAGAYPTTRTCTNDNNAVFPVTLPASFPAPAPPCLDPPVQPEEIKAYTVGFKSQWFDDRLRFNAEAFYYDYKNLQVQSVLQVPNSILTTTLLTNAAAATMKGVEFDVTWKPIDQFTLNAAVNLQEGRFDDFPNGQFFVTNPNGGNCAFAATRGTTFLCGGQVAPLPPNFVPGRAASGTDPGALSTWNLRGLHTPVTPPWSGSLSGTYDVPISSGNLSFTLALSHTGNYYSEPSNGLGQFDYGPATLSRSNPDNEKQLSVDLVNANVSWTSSDEKYGVRLWGKNLTDEEYFAFNNSTATVTKKVPAAPRTYGINFTARF